MDNVTLSIIQLVVLSVSFSICCVLIIRLRRYSSSVPCIVSPLTLQEAQDLFQCWGYLITLSHCQYLFGRPWSANTQTISYMAEALANYGTTSPGYAPSAKIRLNHRNQSLPLRIVTLLPFLRSTTLTFVALSSHLCLSHWSWILFLRSSYRVSFYHSSLYSAA